VPFLILFAAYGLVWSFGQLKKRRWALIAICWLPIMALLVLLTGEARRRDRGPFLARQETFGVALIREGRVDEGIAQLQDVVQKGPQRITAHFNLGVAYLEEEQQISKAAREFRAVVRLQQDYPDVHRLLARAYWQMGRQPEAFQEWNQELIFWPRNAQARLELAMALVEAKQLVEAQEQFQHILRENPEQPDVLRSLGNVFYLQGKWEQAMHTWKQALEMNPADVGLHENLAKLREQMERRDADR
jgi:tetratricopeptide (TPR) repeat protein